jgi:CBS domain-containing protein
MLDRPIKEVMQRRKLLLAPPTTVVARAAKLMAARNVGAVLVVDGEQLVGIFTERDALIRVLAHGLDADSTPIGDVMTREPQTVDPEKPFGYALMLMHESGFRHLPVVVQGKPVGIISARSAMDPELEEFVSEAQRRVHYREAGGT